MQTHEEIRRDLPDDLTRSESDSLTAIAMRLQALRPAPGPGFRGELRRRLLGVSRSERGREGMRTPRGVRALAAAYVAAGALLLAVAAAGLAGGGPFATG